MKIRVYSGEGVCRPVAGEAGADLLSLYHWEKSHEDNIQVLQGTSVLQMEV